MGQRVFLIRNVDPDNFGGGETYQIKLGLLLKQYGFEPYILTASLKLLKEAKVLGISTIQVPYCKKQNWSGVSNVLFLRYYFWQRRLAKFYSKVFKQYHPVVVNVQSRDDFIAATNAAKRMNIKVLWTDHMDFRTWVLTNVGVWYKNWIGKWILKVAKKVDEIVFISDYECDWFREHIPTRDLNTITIKNGVIDQKRDFKNTKVVPKSFCFIGRMVEYKGIFELTRAFKLIAKKYPDARLDFYGDGIDKEKCAKIATSCKQISFFDYTDNPIQVLAEHEVFILPSYKEGLSLSLLDAAMMGKVLIASNVDGNPEVVQDQKTGLLVPAGDTDALSKALLRTIEEPELAKKWGENVRREYEEMFDLEKIFKTRMLNLYTNQRER